MDYYHSPGQTAVAQPEQKPKRRRRGRGILIVFIVLLCLCIAGLTVMRFAIPSMMEFSLADYLEETFGFDFDAFFGSDYDDGFGEYFDEFEESFNNSGPTTIDRADPDPDVEMVLHTTKGPALSYQLIYKKVLPSIVSVQTEYSLGTGVIMTENGYIVTNHHVIEGADEASVVLIDGAEFPALLVGSDPESDLAVLKIDAKDLPAAEFGNSDTVQVGDTALAIGNPLGTELFGTMTEGIVSAINRDVVVEGYDMTLIQTTAALNPGNSGGALLNDRGQVIGITNMKMMSSYDTIEGLGFAIPTVWAKEVVDQLLDEGKISGRPTIGITCYAATLTRGDTGEPVSGIYVETVTSGSPADKAGLQSGDLIVTCNGVPVPTLEELTAVRDEVGVGGAMEMEVLRDDEMLNMTMILVEQYELN